MVLEKWIVFLPGIKHNIFMWMIYVAMEIILALPNLEGFWNKLQGFGKVME